MLETGMLLAEVWVHEHWWPQWKPLGWEWRLIKKLCTGQEPWSSVYGWRFMFESSWVLIPVPYTVCCKNCIFSLKRPKINEKDAGVGSFKKTVVYLFSTIVHNSFDETTHLANTLSLNIVTDQKGKLVRSQESYTTTFSETRILLFLHFCAEM